MSPHVLALDVAGAPHRWINVRDAAHYYATDMIAWATAEQSQDPGRPDGVPAAGRAEELADAYRDLRADDEFALVFCKTRIKESVMRKREYSSGCFRADEQAT
jgi:hypothetical protein